MTSRTAPLVIMILVIALAWPGFGQKRRNPSLSRERGDCKYRGSRVCNGAIVKTFRLSSLARVCEDGRMVVKRTKDITAAQFKLSERNSREKDCTWYGEAFCHGDEVIDLYRWWFTMTCSNGKMRMKPRQWGDVVSDPRFGLRD